MRWGEHEPETSAHWERQQLFDSEGKLIAVAWKYRRDEWNGTLYIDEGTEVFKTLDEAKAALELAAITARLEGRI